jgi:hypothetical protein
MLIYLEPLERFGKAVFVECCRCSVRRVEPWAEAEIAVLAELLTRMVQKKRRTDSAQR